jgi:hypothetical protein
MPDPSSCTFSDVHTRAICDEVGDRLRFLLDRSQTPPPPGIQALLLQLQLSEMKAPALEQRPHSAHDIAAAG